MAGICSHYQNVPVPFKADIAAFLFCHIYNEFLDNASASVSKLFSFRFDLWFHFR